MKQNRRAFVGTMLAGAAMSAYPRIAGAQAKSVEVRCNINPTLNNANFLVADAKGYFQDEDVKVNMPLSFLDQSQMVQLLSGGQLDVAHVSGSPQGNNALLRGAPIKIIAGGSRLSGPKEKSTSFVLVRDEIYQQGIRSIADLKGQTIDLWPGLNAPIGRVMIRMLEQAGLKHTDVTWNSWNNLSQLGQSFEAGTVKIAYLLEPMATVIMDKVKAHVIGRGSEAMTGNTTLVVWANTDWLRVSGDGPVRFLKGLLRGSNYYCDARESGFAKNPDVQNILAEKTKVSASLIGRIGLPDFSRDGDIKISDLTEEAEFLVSRGALKEIVPFANDSVVDLSYAKRAYAELVKEKKI